MEEILEVSRVSKQFGGLQALNDVSFTVASGEVVAVIGPNGAGKTTLFNVITGCDPEYTGDVAYRGVSLHGRRVDVIARGGMIRTFQNLRLFSRLTAFENVKIAAISDGTRRVDDAVMDLLDQHGLLGERDRLACELPYGLQKKLEFVRALACRPTMLLLDEPVAGLNATESAAAVASMREFVSGGTTSIVVVEHDMVSVRALANRVVVLDHGVVIASGEPAEVLMSDVVVSSYLGGAINA